MNIDVKEMKEILAKESGVSLGSFDLHGEPAVGVLFTRADFIPLMEKVAEAMIAGHTEPITLAKALLDANRTEFDFIATGDIPYDSPPLPLDGERHTRVSMAKTFLNSLSDEDRHGLLTGYCHGCGSKNLDCQCWNDE